MCSLGGNHRPPAKHLFTDNRRFATEEAIFGDGAGFSFKGASPKAKDISRSSSIMGLSF
jgi:hypothetical protein